MTCEWNFIISSGDYMPLLQCNSQAVYLDLCPWPGELRQHNWFIEHNISYSATGRRTAALLHCAGQRYACLLLVRSVDILHHRRKKKQTSNGLVFWLRCTLFVFFITPLALRLLSTDYAISPMWKLCYWLVFIMYLFVTLIYSFCCIEAAPLCCADKSS